MKKVRPVGVHIRLAKTMQEGISKAVRLGIPLYQCFLMNQLAQYIPLDEDIIENFIKETINHDIEVIFHAAYWSHITRMPSRGFSSLKKEAKSIMRLQKSKLVVHPGSIAGLSKNGENRSQMIAEAVDAFCEKFPNIELLLENSPHSGASFGGNLEDFALLLDHVKDKDRIGFCIDTAHAYAYGYDIVNGFDEFMKELDNTVGFSRVKLLHLNDTLEKRGSKIDKHSMIGEGNIGINGLRRFVQYKSLFHAPIIMELPVIEEEKEKNIIQVVHKWIEEI